MEGFFIVPPFTVFLKKWRDLFLLGKINIRSASDLTYPSVFWFSGPDGWIVPVLKLDWSCQLMRQIVNCGGKWPFSKLLLFLASQSKLPFRRFLTSGQHETLEEKNRASKNNVLSSITTENSKRTEGHLEKLVSYFTIQFSFKTTLWSVDLIANTLALHKEP